MGRFILLSGPSCVGKGPLFRTILRLDKDLREKVQKIVLYNDRERRLGEVDGEDYHFRSPEEVSGLPTSDFVKVNLGSDAKPNWQALELAALEKARSSGLIAFLEAHYTIVERLQDMGMAEESSTSSVFISPLSKAEIKELKTRSDVKLPDFVTSVMRRKLLRRTLRSKGILSLPDLEDIEKRAGRAPKELAHAHRYNHIIPNHDGENNDNWEQHYYPLGDARTAYMAFRAILRAEQPQGTETWGSDTFPEP